MGPTRNVLSSRPSHNGLARHIRSCHSWQGPDKLCWNVLTLLQPACRNLRQDLLELPVEIGLVKELVPDDQSRSRRYPIPLIRLDLQYKDSPKHQRWQKKRECHVPGFTFQLDRQTNAHIIKSGLLKLIVTLPLGLMPGTDLQYVLAAMRHDNKSVKLWTHPSLASVSTVS